MASRDSTRQGCVYLARNKINRKVYVGKTIQPFSTRKKMHYSQAKNGSPMLFHRAIRKYGFECFEWTILFVSYDESDLLEMEKEFIAKFLSKGKKGYNQTDGGEGISGCRRIFTDKHRANLLAARHKRGPVSDDARARMSASHKGKKLSREQVEKQRAKMIGRKMPADAIAKTAAFHRGRKRGPQSVEHIAKRMAALSDTCKLRPSYKGKQQKLKPLIRIDRVGGWS